MQGKITISFENLEELIELINNVYGFDLSGYAKASLKRRVSRILTVFDLDILELKHKLVNTPGFVNTFLSEITVNVTEMFRDPTFYKTLRHEIAGYLSTFPHIKVWSAGCATGEEVYSLAILLHNEGLYDRAFIYGTDVNPEVIDQARKGMIDLKRMKIYSDNYLHTESGDSLSEYYTTQYDVAVIHNGLLKNTLFATHNLVSDGVFNEFQLITCRNVLIYFNSELQQHITNLFYTSLSLFGFLCLGAKETLRTDALQHKFRLVNKTHNIYQKIA